MICSQFDDQQMVFTERFAVRCISNPHHTWKIGLKLKRITWQSVQFQWTNSKCHLKQFLFPKCSLMWQKLTCIDHFFWDLPDLFVRRVILNVKNIWFKLDTVVDAVLQLWNKSSLCFTLLCFHENVWHEAARKQHANVGFSCNQWSICAVKLDKVQNYFQMLSVKCLGF